MKKTLFTITMLAVLAYFSYAELAKKEIHDHSKCSEAEHIESNNHNEETYLDDHAGHNHEGEDGHEDEAEDAHAGHNHEEGAIILSKEEMDEIGIKTAVANHGTVDLEILLPGEVKLNEDKVSHVVPRVEGIVVEVFKSLGDIVTKGEVMAVIESRELANLKADYLAANERFELANLIFNREEKLWKEKISSEQEYLEAKQAFTTASIEQRLAKQKLLAIGYKAPLNELKEQDESLFSRFEILAPLSGEVIGKHIVPGEVVNIESTVFVLADLSNVWVDLQIYHKYTTKIKEGQKVAIEIDKSSPAILGTIDYTSATIGIDSRTAIARVVLENSSGTLKPGLFVTARVSTNSHHAEVIIKKTALQVIDGKKCVFIKDEDGFEHVEIEIGKENSDVAEVIAGLLPGEEYVVEGAFDLKSKIVTSTLDSHAGHGH